MDGQLMGEFEAEAKDLEADSWSLGVEPQYLQQLDRELVKRQDVIYGVFHRAKLGILFCLSFSAGRMLCKRPVFVPKKAKDVSGF